MREAIDFAIETAGAGDEPRPRDSRSGLVSLGRAEYTRVLDGLCYEAMINFSFLSILCSYRPELLLPTLFFLYFHNSSRSDIAEAPQITC